MKKTIGIAILAISSTINVFANNITTINWASNHSPIGGEFVMSQPDIPSFNTFCLEKNEYINIGSTYNYNVDTKTDGGISGPNDEISIGTAWLYNNFSNKTLPGYVSTYSQQVELQNVIWWLENETSTITLNENKWIQMLQTSLNEDIRNNANGRLGVCVWNLVDTQNRHYQSQLAMSSVQVPDGGSTLCLMSMGMFGLLFFRKH